MPASAPAPVHCPICCEKLTVGIKPDRDGTYRTWVESAVFKVGKD